MVRELHGRSSVKCTDFHRPIFVRNFKQKQPIRSSQRSSFNRYRFNDSSPIFGVDIHPPYRSLKFFFASFRATDHPPQNCFSIELKYFACKINVLIPTPNFAKTAIFIYLFLNVRFPTDMSRYKMQICQLAPLLTNTFGYNA